jgi:hypothetical protein
MAETAAEDPATAVEDLATAEEDRERAVAIPAVDIPAVPGSVAGMEQAPGPVHQAGPRAAATITRPEESASSRVWASD